MMLLLLHIIWSALVSTQLVQLASLDEATSEFVCLDQSCYSVSWDSQRYSKAKKSCRVKKGQLLTVKNTVQADAIAMFMTKEPREDVKVWIGLEQPYSNRCTDLQQPLRGFTWVTGDSHTDYTNWKKEEQKCGAHCVTVRKDGTWEEVPCDSKADGYLCEISYSSTCFSLELPFSYNVTYYHLALGMASTGGTVFPPGTTADISTFPAMTKLSCEEKADGTVAWSSETPGAWSCLIVNGGCEHECLEESDTAECKCPSGSELKADRRGCTKPCDPSPCSQLCVPVSDSPGFLCMCSEGYTLGADGRSCEDIDDCAANPNICEQHCTNTVGGFVCGCKPGFEMVETCEPGENCGSLCLDIDECVIPTTLCEHGCENLEGDYRCYCDDGYVIDDKNPMKCKRFCNTSFCEADCDINNNDSCQCPEGYIVDQNNDGVYICSDVDECDASPCEWSDSCINTFGSFLCTCPDGYTAHNDACIPPEGSGGTEPTSAPPSQTSPPTTRPPDIHSLQPAMLLGICIGIISMLTVLLAILCHMLRKHYIEEHALDYKCKNAEKDMVLQQVTTEPQHKL